MNRKQRFIIDAVNMMFYISGHDMSYAKVVNDKTEWYKRYEMTEKNHKEWKEWFIDNAVKLLKISKESAKNEFFWFDLSYGLKIKQ